MPIIMTIITSDQESNEVSLQYQSSLLILQGGGTVRFFHRTHECYIVAEGSFAGRFASIKVIEGLKTKSHDERGESSPSITKDVQTEFSGDATYQDSPAFQHMLGSHVQQVEVEVYESSDRGDSVLECAPLSSIRSHRLNRTENIFSPESSLKVTDQAATMQKSLTLDLTDGENQHVVTNDGK